MNSIIELKSVTKRFVLNNENSSSKGILALDNVSFTAAYGEITSLVGESGSGKSTLAKIVCGLVKADKGDVYIKDKLLNDYTSRERSELVQMIFQDPFASLNPRLCINTILSEALLITDKSQKEKKIFETLDLVGLPRNILESYPFQFSGGQRQRIAIARAVLRNPAIILADEPLSSLDVSIQSQIIDIFKTLKKNKTSFLFITHDIMLARAISDKIVVMQNGRIVESGGAEIIDNPSVEYTKMLVNSLPRFNYERN